MWRNHSSLCSPFSQVSFQTAHGFKNAARQSRCNGLFQRDIRVDRRESFWSKIKELCGDDLGDPGHWNFSPEWYGVQGGGWGRNQGEVLFSKESPFNGKVEVTAHPVERFDEEEWRVLRFNDKTRQSTNRVKLCHSSVAARPECLAQDYLKSVASVFAAMIGLRDDDVLKEEEMSGLEKSSARIRVLCIVEIDPVVVQAAEFMGFNPELVSNECDAISIHVQDAKDFVQNALAKAPYDFVYLDAFDGDDNVPSELCTNEFAAGVASIIHPDRGSFIMNIHGEGIETQAHLFHDVFVEKFREKAAVGFSIRCQKQQNTILCCSLVPSHAAVDPSVEKLENVICHAGSTIGDERGFTFPVGRRLQKIHFYSFPSFTGE